MTAEETIASLEAQLKQALEQLGQVTEQLQQRRVYAATRTHTNASAAASGTDGERGRGTALTGP